METIPLKFKYIPDIVSWIKSESDMIQWAGRIFNWPMTQKQFKEHVREGKNHPQTLFPFVTVKNDRLIGYCELSSFHRPTNQASLTRVIISPDHRNKGIASVMIKEVLNFGFGTLDLNRVALGVFDFNETAIKCYKKLGFSLEGTMRESAKAGDTYWNCHLMSILKREWNR